MRVEDDALRRRERLRRAGELIFGERYQRALADLLTVSQSTVAQIATDRLDLSVELEERLCAVALAQADELSKRSMMLARLAVEIADDRRRRPKESSTASEPAPSPKKMEAPRKLRMRPPSHRRAGEFY